VGGRAPHDPPHEIESVVAAGEREARLVAVLARQTAHCGCRDIGRVADDQVVGLPVQAREQVGLDQVDAAAKPVGRDVHAGNRECRGRDVGGVDARAWKSPSKHYRETARPGT